MSGFFAVFFALNVCDKVDLYGFDAYTSKKRSYRYHYFDNVQGFTDVHSFDLALEGSFAESCQLFRSSMFVGPSVCRQSINLRSAVLSIPNLTQSSIFD